MRWLARYWILICLLTIHTVMLGYGAAIHAPGWDEVGHLPAGLSHWQLGNTELYRVNPPLVRMLATLPLLGIDWDVTWAWSDAPRARPEFNLGKRLWTQHGVATYTYLTYARWAVIPFSLLAAVVIFRWSQDLYGGAAGLLAVSLWCFSPLVLANAQMITPDIGSASLGVLAAFMFNKWLSDRATDLALLAGILLGLAQLTKFTWIILFGLWPLLWLLYFVSSHRQTGQAAVRGLPWRAALRWPEAGQLTLILLLSLVVINVGYAWEGTMTRLGDYRFVSRSFRGNSALAGGQVVGNRFSDHWLGSVPVPFPRNYVLGIDRQKYDFDSGRFSSYLRGQWRDRGWWYYYIYGLLVKEPIGFILLAVLAVGTSVRRRNRWRDEWLLLAPAVAVIVLVSSQTGFNHHLRYVLPAFPAVFIWMGKLWGLASEGESPVGWRVRRRVAAVMLAGGVLSSVATFPHSRAYFNEFVGGPLRGHNHLLDSNIDWGQDLLLLANWAERNPDMKLDGVAYSLSHLLPLADLGLPENQPPRSWNQERDELGPSPRQSFGPRPGLWAVFARPLREKHEHYTYFQFFEPIEVLGYTVYIYQLDQADVDRYWKAGFSAM